MVGSFGPVIEAVHLKGGLSQKIHAKTFSSLGKHFIPLCRPLNNNLLEANLNSGSELA